MKEKKEQYYQERHGNQSELYQELIVGRTTYHITCTFLGTIDLCKTLENLAVSRVLADLEIQTKSVLTEVTVEGEI